LPKGNSFVNVEAEDAAPASEPKSAPAEHAEETSKEETPAAKPAAVASHGVVEWFWGGKAMRRARETRPSPTSKQLFYQSQANLCLELGRSALEPLQPLEYGPAHAAACEQYREAIYWALCGRNARADLDGAALRPSAFDALWDATDRAWLLRAAGDDSAALDGIAASVKHKSFVDFAELPPDAARELSGTLRRFAEALVDAVDPAQAEVERIWMRRIVRVGSLLAASIVALVVGVIMLDSRENDRDVAVGKPWEVSSRWGGGCNSPEQRCEDSPYFFFHTTQENDPFLIIDLSAPTRISGVKVENRPDCCQERAVPLVVEVSTDKQRWTEVAQRKSDFSSWKASFPAVEARYVKLHVPRVTNLHLKRVRVLR
jgi:hypothetical protein